MYYISTYIWVEYTLGGRLEGPSLWEIRLQVANNNLVWEAIVSESFLCRINL
jgi:hypothetical protein